MLYLITIGFTQIYPLLFPVLNLTNHLQSDFLSCVDMVLIVEYYLSEMKKNIRKYIKSENVEIANDLIKSIKKRLLLNTNVQLYQLASILTPDGIVRYRNKMKKTQPEYDIQNDSYQYWHNDAYFVEQ